MKVGGLTFVSDVVVTLTLKSHGLTLRRNVLAMLPPFKGETPHLGVFC